MRASSRSQCRHEVLDRFDFVDRTAAFRGIHHPETMHEGEEARRRLVFDELLRLQLALVLRKRALERRSAGIAHDVGGELVRRFHDRLPYDLTGAQATRHRGDRARPRAQPSDAPAAAG